MTAAMSMMVPISEALVVPEVTQTEIDSFHETHFGSNALHCFQDQFLRPEDGEKDDEQYEDHYNEADEDDLGYYPDGVKRTLTDEQIAIFRHSELEGLRRADARISKHKVESATLFQEAKEQDAVTSTHEEATNNVEESEHERKARDGVAEASEDGEIETERPQLTKSQLNRKKRKRAKQKHRENKKFCPEKKPDLRKRTWDIVETGMDTLDYDDAEKSRGSGTISARKRDLISYDD
ncbi:hypothetical protein F5Y15DRAFT_291660 [Xylariaceae sp. FL0016]|nr:hypothetical protein F5Y15DRAFT_291660 [Xylariaceae sp. FL0016]